MVLKIPVFSSAHNYCVCIDAFLFWVQSCSWVFIDFLGSHLAKRFTYAYYSCCLLALCLFDFSVQLVGLFKNMEFLHLPC